ncbi:MAG TPA: ElyC/SanA/YdcF family protein [Polyangiaceae bacterium]|jgi:vancomycin permeability regulator SanA|nr:ElyC/SanA/YdcF family protein [Polyangiaceae bacterium]
MRATHLVLILGCRVLPDGTPSSALQRRVQAALSSAAALPGARFLAVGGAHGQAPAEALVIERMLIAAGVPPSAILASPSGLTTIESLCACWPLLERALAEEPGATLHVSTDGYHTLRCRAILALWGRPARAAPAPRPRLPRHRLWLLRVRERAALFKDVPLALYWRATGKLRSG